MTKKIFLAAFILAVGVMVMGAVLAFGPSSVEAAAQPGADECVPEITCVIEWDGTLRCWNNGCDAYGNSD